MFDKEKSYIENLRETFDYVIHEESEIITKLCKILEDLLQFSKHGINKFEEYRI